MPTSPLFVDAVTPLNAVTLNKLLPLDAVAIASARTLASYLAAADAQPAFQLNGDGKHQWGPGGATALDTNLYRSAAAVLQTDGGFVAAGLAGANTAALQATSANGGYTGSLIEGIATFRGDVTGYNLLRLANTNGARFTVRGDGSLLFFSDTNLYRSAAGILKTDNSFITAGNLSVLLATGDTQPQIVLSRNFAGSGLPGIQFGVGGSTAGDTNLYRAAAGLLTTDTSMRVNQQLQVGVGANLAISANAITITASYHALTGTGPLKTINGVVSGSGVSLLVLRNGTGAALVIDSTGNIYATGGAGSIVLPNNETVALYYDASSSVWRVLHVSTTPAIQLIQTITLGANGTFSFQNIPAVYSHLEIRGMVRSALAATVDTPWIRFNNDTAANYSTQQIGANSATPYANQIAGLGAAYPQANVIDANSQSAGIFTPVVLHIPGYASTTWHKMFYVMHHQAATGWTELMSGRWASTAAINRIDYTAAGTNLVAGSMLSLYGITG